MERKMELRSNTPLVRGYIGLFSYLYLRVLRELRGFSKNP